MRDVLRGALAAALVYPLVWYYCEPDPAVPASTAARATIRQAAPREDTPLQTAPSVAATEHTAAERSAGRSGEESARARSSSGHPNPNLEQLRSDPPLEALPELTELKEALALLAELQERAHDPKELEKRVQTLDEDPEKLARLRAFAERFVQLPSSRGESYLPGSGSGDAVRSASGR